MRRYSGISCCFCECPLEEPEYIAVDDDDEIIAMCEDCYSKAAKFFKTRRRKNVHSRSGNQRPKQEVQDESDK